MMLELAGTRGQQSRSRSFVMLVVEGSWGVGGLKRVKLLELAGTFEFRDPRRGKGKGKGTTRSLKYVTLTRKCCQHIFTRAVKRNLFFCYNYCTSHFIPYIQHQPGFALLLLRVDRMTLPMLCLLGRPPSAKAQPSQDIIRQGRHKCIRLI